MNFKNLLFIASLIILSACKTEDKSITIDEKQIKKVVNTTMDNWHLAATNANFDNYFNKMDSISVFIGTDASENWTKDEFIAFSKPYFDKGKAWDFKTLERNVYLSETGNVAWFDELLDTWMGTCRGSGVLEKTDENWKIKHYVLSVTIPNDDIQKVIIDKKENDSKFLEKFK